MYQNNNTYLMTGTDGLDHLMYHLNEVLDIGGDMLIFWFNHVMYFILIAIITPMSFCFYTPVNNI